MRNYPFKCYTGYIGRKEKKKKGNLTFRKCSIKNSEYTLCDCTVTHEASWHGHHEITFNSRRMNSDKVISASIACVYLSFRLHTSLLILPRCRKATAALHPYSQGRIHLLRALVWNGTFEDSIRGKIIPAYIVYNVYPNMLIWARSKS